MADKQIYYAVLNDGSITRVGASSDPNNALRASVAKYGDKFVSLHTDPGYKMSSDAEVIARHDQSAENWMNSQTEIAPTAEQDYSKQMASKLANAQADVYKVGTDPVARERLVQNQGQNPWIAAMFPYSAKAKLEGREPEILKEGLSDAFSFGRYPAAAMAALTDPSATFRTELGRRTEDLGTTTGGQIVRSPKTGALTVAGMFVPPVIAAGVEGASAATGLASLGGRTATLGAEALGMGGLGVLAGKSLGEEGPSDAAADFILNAIPTYIKGGMSMLANTKLANSVAMKFGVGLKEAKTWIDAVTATATHEGRLASTSGGSVLDKLKRTAYRAADAITPKSAYTPSSPEGLGALAQGVVKTASDVEESIVTKATPILSGTKDVAEAVNDFDAILSASRRSLDPAQFEKEAKVLTVLKNQLNTITGGGKPVTAEDMRSILTPENLELFPELRAWYSMQLTKAGTRSAEEGSNLMRSGQYTAEQLAKMTPDEKRDVLVKMAADHVASQEKLFKAYDLATGGVMSSFGEVLPNQLMKRSALVPGASSKIPWLARMTLEHPQIIQGGMQGGLEGLNATIQGGR